jgi:magnesium transporter
MPSLPRIGPRRARTSAASTETDTRPRITEVQGDGLTWIHWNKPTYEEAQLLAERFGWHPLDIEDVLSRRQRPKVDVYTEEESSYLFAVLHFPVYDKTIGRLNAGELDVFLGPDYLVTFPTVELRPVTLLFRRCYENEDLRHNLFSRGSGRLFYEVLDDLYDYCFPIVDKIGYKLEQIDEQIDDVAIRAKDLVRDIHKAKQEIISYRKIIKPQRPTLRQLERGVERFLPEELELYFDDIVDASERIWDILDNYKEVVEALEDTNESVISHQQNDILYVLTIFSVVILPLTFLTGLFGMNVDFPASGAPRPSGRSSGRSSSSSAGCSGSSATSAGSEPAVGLFRPARKVTSPSGDYWELYVSKTALPAWREEGDGFEPGVEAVNPEIGIVELPMVILDFLWSSILVPLARMMVLLPIAAVKGRRSHAVRIEAVTTFPQQHVLLWTTTDVHKDRVLDEIAAGLAQGKVVRPSGAVYSGEE